MNLFTVSVLFEIQKWTQSYILSSHYQETNPKNLHLIKKLNVATRSENLNHIDLKTVLHDLNTIDDTSTAQTLYRKLDHSLK